MKRAFIIHGWGGTPDEGWLPWLGEELKADCFDVLIPAMPDTSVPVIEKWVSHLASVVGTVDSNTFFIGHSIGCQAIMRFVERLPRDQVAGGAVFVAPFFTLAGYSESEPKEVADPWINTHIEDIAVQEHLPSLTCLFSDNDPDVPPENEAMFRDRLEAYTIMLHDKGHFSGSDGINELPEALEEVRMMSDPSYS